MDHREFTLAELVAATRAHPRLSYDINDMGWIDCGENVYLVVDGRVTRVMTDNGDRVADAVDENFCKFVLFAGLRSAINADREREAVTAKIKELACR
jgi:hypothetical protein